MTYRIKKYIAKTDTWTDYGGGYTLEDVKQITKGYKFNGLFYTRENTFNFYTVDEEI